jgi:signal transduction histidine kinase
MNSFTTTSRWRDFFSRRAVLGICLVVGVVASFLAVYLSTRQTAQEQELLRLQTVSDILTDYLQNIFVHADSATISIESELRKAGARSPEKFRLYATRAETHNALRLITLESEIEAITLVDHLGQFQGSSRSWPAPPINVADRDYFITSRENLTIPTFHSGMVRNRATGQRTMFWGRRVACDDGTALCGLILATLRTEGFQTFLSNNLPNSEAIISIYRQDGSLLLTTPETETPTAISLEMWPNYESRIRETGARVSFVEPANASRPAMLTALSSLAYPRLVIATTTPQSVALHNWMAFSRYLAMFAGAALLLAALCWRAIVQESRSKHQANERSAQLAQANADLQSVNEALESANHSLETFSYSVSHDLRAPLRAIDGHAAMLQGELNLPEGSEANKLLGRIRANSQRMAGLLQNLLDLSRYSMVEMTRETIDMRAKVDSIISELGSEAAAAKFEIEDIPACRGDKILIWEVWTNLISNALKYSAKNPDPIIRIGFRDGEYFVEDNGTGFDMAYRDKLFKLFSRLHHEREYAGTGIGLAIVKRIIERHGGHIHAEGRPGKGATFAFHIPG